MKNVFIENGIVIGDVLTENPGNPMGYDVEEVSDEVQADWVKNAQGEFRPPAPVPDPIPAVVSIFQACEALEQAGYLDAVEAYMASDQADAKDKRAWRTISEVRRSSPLMLKMAGLIGITEAQVDDLFRAAGKIQA